MANVVQRDWGVSIQMPRDTNQPKKRNVIDEGINCVKPKSFIPLHYHMEDCEEYIPKTEGLKIVVLPVEDANSMAMYDIELKLKMAQDAELGTPVMCLKGNAHALYNSSDKMGVLIFTKYRTPDTFYVQR